MFILSLIDIYFLIQDTTDPYSLVILYSDGSVCPLYKKVISLQKERTFRPTS